MMEFPNILWNVTKILAFKRFTYPFRKYPCTCVVFLIIITLISLIAFYGGIADDRGFILKNYLVNTFIVGDFDSYERTLTEIIQDIFKVIKSDDFKNVGIVHGPIMPILILISKLISNNLIPFFILSLYVSLWVISLTLDIAKEIIPWLDSQINLKTYKLSIFRGYKVSLSPIELFGIILNPIFVYYVVFPASDLFFGLIVLSIIFLFYREKYSYCYILYLISILLRPTGLFLFPAISYISYYGFRRSKNLRFYSAFMYAFLVAATFIALNYYLGYLVVNFSDTIKYGLYGDGLNLWGLPIPGWILNQKYNLNLEINKIISILFTPFIQLISVLGIRPSYSTIFLGKADTTLSIVSIKPYFYAYIRIIWASFLLLPGLISLFLTFLKLKKKEILIILIIIFSFAIGLSSSIALERYLFFAHPLLSVVGVSFYLKFFEILNHQEIIRNK